MPCARDARRQMVDSRQAEAERRQLTVMFCDLVGSTAIGKKEGSREQHATEPAQTINSTARVPGEKGGKTMRCGRMLLVVLVVGLLCVPMAARADDMAALKAAFAQIDVAGRPGRKGSILIVIVSTQD